MRRGNRHLVGVVLGGRSGGSRDAIMRGLLAENLEKAASKRTVAAIAERNSADANADVAEAETASRPAQAVQVQVASSEPAAAPTVRSTAPSSRSIIANAAAAVPPQAKAEPAPLTNGVIQSQQIAAIPGSSEPMKPVKVKTVQVKAGQIKLASANPAQASASAAQPAPPAHPQAVQQNGAIKPVAAHTGWIVQVGALDSETEAQQRIEAARSQARGLLTKADPFTEPVVAKGDKKLFRARFAGLDRDQAEAVCRALKRSDISCITIKN